MNRTDVDDLPLDPVVDHVLRGQPGTAGRRTEIEADLCLPVLHRHILESARRNYLRSADVVDQHVNPPAEPLEKFAEHPFAFAVVADVRLEELRLDPEFPAAVERPLRPRVVAMEIDTDVAAGTGKLHRRRRSDSLGRPCDQHISSFRHEKSLLFPVETFF